MSDFPRSQIPPIAVSSFMLDGCALEACTLSTVAVASAAWPSANLAIFMPFTIRVPTPVVRFFWANGSTVTGNMDVGIYTPDGTRIASQGSTAQTGFASLLQFPTAISTKVILPPGPYYFGAACSGTTNAGFGQTVTAAEGRMAGLLQMATAIPLPATATFAQWSGTLLPIVGFWTL